MLIYSLSFYLCLQINFEIICQNTLPDFLTIKSDKRMHVLTRLYDMCFMDSAACI